MTERNHAAMKDGSLQPENIPDVLDRMDGDDKDHIMKDFEQFRSYLAKRIRMAKAIGLSEEELAVAAQRVGDYLAAKEEPQNAEERLLQELWKVGREDERHKLAHMLVRMAQPKGH